MSKTKLEYRMYGLVPYNLSPIQQGIQFGHAVVEYMIKFRDFPDLTKWAEEDKTFIILNGGTTNDNFIDYIDCEFKGTLNNYAKELYFQGIKTATFNEPDLGNQLTAVVFLVDERVFNKTKYPDINMLQSWEHKWTEFESPKELEKIMFLRNFLTQFKLA
jgi:hypothetical protein